MEAVRADLHACGREGLFLEPACVRDEARYSTGNGASEPHLRQRREHLLVIAAIAQLLPVYANEEREAIERDAVFLSQRSEKLGGATVVLNRGHGHLPVKEATSPHANIVQPICAHLYQWGLLLTTRSW